MNQATASRQLISVIVPVYKVEKYLARCVESILGQTHREIEVILVDDGSPDKCPMMCDEYARHDSRVKVIHQANGGLSNARNAGIDIASGAFIGFVDGDDYISREMYGALYTALKAGNADMSVCNFHYVGENEADQFDNSNLPVKDGVLSSLEVITDKLCADKNWYWVIACNKLFRRELFSGLRYPAGKLHEDEFVIHKLLLQCKRVAGVAKALYFYLQRHSGITSSAYSVRRLDSAEAHFDRAEMILTAGIDARAAYYACSAGLLVMAKGYEQLSFRDPQFRQRYLQLSAQFRPVAAALMKAELPFLVKARLALNRVSPYFTWKCLERYMRGMRKKTPASGGTPLRGT